MLSLVLPTYNESANLPELLKRITTSLDGEDFEVILVDDDSPDKTWQKAEEMTKQYPMLRVLRRVGRRGLSSAVIEGFLLAKGDILMVMDADLQHDPAIILDLQKAVRDGAVIAVASRYIEGGSVGDWVAGRRILSKTATYIAQKLPNVESTDPMSGFFAVRADAFHAIKHKLRPTGFKILLEVLAFLPRGSRIQEVPLTFNMRLHGESKLSFMVELQFLWQLVRIAYHRVARASMWIFLIVVLGMLLVMLPRIWNLRFLLINSSVRSSVQHLLTEVSDKQGWLLSDISVQSIYDDHVRIVHREHHRGKDEEQCAILSFDSPLVAPCED